MGLEDHSKADEGLKAAFGAANESALDAIERLTGARSHVLLHAAEDGGSPILRIQHEIGDDERYQVVGEIARGGIGVIYKGRDKDLGRDVALKVLRGDFAGDGEVVQRFIEEAQVGGQLQHPGIVPIYGLGMQPDGRPYFAMKLIKGRTLTALLEEKHKSAELIGIFERVAQTIAYAHSRGVIHRDLKPANIMVGAFGEVQVVDWGFAKVLGREEEHSRPNVTMIATVRSEAEGSQSIAGSVMGTPAYMPPEQALGQIDELTERSDVFALGAILCEILTKRPPYTGSNQDQLLAASQARLDEAYKRLDECNAPDELKQLTRDCLQPLPKDRPEHAAAVAQRLGDHLASVERRARQAELDAIEAAATARREQRKRRQTIALAALVLIAVVLGGGGYYTWSQAEAKRAKKAGRRVVAKMREATAFEGEEQWPQAESAAQTALTLARTRGADDDTRSAAAALHARIQRSAAAAERAAKKAQAEADLLDRLDEIRLEGGDHFDIKRTDAAYAAALPDLAALRDFDRKEELAEHLESWASMRQSLGGNRKRLDEMVRRLDGDPWRTRLREAGRRKDLATLRRLAADADGQPPFTRRSLAHALREAGDRQLATAVLRRAHVRYPADFWIQYFLADSIGSRHAEAIPHIKAAIALRPTSAGAWNSLGMARMALDDVEGAIRAYRVAVRLLPDSPIVHDNLGTALCAQGDAKGAIEAHRTALRLEPGRPSAHNNLGNALETAGDLDGALAELREAVRLAPRMADVHSNLGRVLRLKRDLDGAVNACREAIRLDPAHANAHLHLASALAERGDLDDALAAARGAVRLAPGKAGVHSTLGTVLYQNDDLDGALEAYNAALRLDAELATAHYGIGTVFAARRDYRRAIAKYRESIRLGPARAKYHNALGTALYSLGDLEAAIEALRAAIRLDPVYVKAHVNLGTALSEKGDLDGAIAAWRLATRLDPNHAAAHAHLGHALLSKRDFESAATALREAIRLDDTRGAPHNGLGVLLIRKGDIDGAIVEFRAAVRLLPHERAARRNHARALRKRYFGALTRGTPPTDARARLGIAELNFYARKYEDAVRLFKLAFESDPKASRYLGACAAAKAGDHALALEWLRIELEACRKLPQVLRYWRDRDDDLEDVSPPTADEDWKKFWAEVDEVLKK